MERSNLGLTGGLEMDVKVEDLNATKGVK